ncbi:MAG TPA: HypC/HybG/HupF family hydrogenase formation chaperone [Nitrosomonas nitrosa]|jgi:hydrogenase expression/formation protein HypC|uniref:Hydrogenase expression/formation protein HypC n=1 Tax=Nitrosomonas nitrosa TaxID=52442 RepID=A0A1I4R0C8_9PROT|nr:HypC/HybG/HupF family hydrogenase formation chaperone [Nitrosomonas nitrosa]MCW5597519.1 HypC/HybG/HupF family hydrogenase formation chaperone [Nitrosomonas sp.]MCO6434915.1 HypC/HybG/HupF family hydrogenase formation chaperone [Nitrosomonas nitrosa]PTR00124.1 hydrogenase expression/formation protein HypC [Nitrosomonas nitrosa]CAE6509408.1 Hydrogenase expression/formation protein HypC [Nitrosomonas nitrosa]SFM45545.1 hydrogenase expression/formation protein HypC [Nitrosomonas nitrosa]
MCLAIPACVEEIVSEDCAIVNLSGIRREVSLALMENVEIGDYVIVHVGFALQKIDPLEAQQTLAMFAKMQNEDDPFADN